MKPLKLISGTVICVILFAFTNPEVDIVTDSINSLFKIERSKDANQIFYEVNLNDSGAFNIKNPINIYWRKNTEGGKIKPLTWVQKKYAYGLKFLKIDDEYATFRFVSTKKMYFTLKKIKNNRFEVYTKYHDKLLNINRFYIQLDGGSFWFPNITAVKIYATNVKTGEAVIETITPKN